jgi:hypothetical protein
LLVALAVEVICPDGKERLVQFSSLTQATAIQKGLFSAVTLFKRRVYRGSWLEPIPQVEHDSDNNDDDEDDDGSTEREMQQYAIEKSVLQAVQENGALGDTMVPDTCLRSVLISASPPPSALQLKQQQEMALHSAGDNDLAVPASRFWEEDMAKYMRGEKDKEVDHLVLVVHGIGEMMRTTGLFGLAIPNLSSIVDCCGYLRTNHVEVQRAHFPQMYPSADATTTSSTGRTDYVPVEWHEAFSIFSQRRAVASPFSSEKEAKDRVMINNISLRTIPNMRHFANDTLMDVLYFMSPEHHDMIVSIVTHEMNVIVDKFYRLTGFNGRVSLIGHSLGSIIAWDILANQNVNVVLDDDQGVHMAPPVEGGGSTADYTTGNRFEASNSDTPELTQSLIPNHVAPVYPQLDFEVDNFFLLGSPVAVFLMIRNQRKPLTEGFFLRGCNRVFNIFHPYDPIAYRIEPCIHPKNCDFEPIIMKHWNGGFRVQYQTKRLWRKLVQTTFRTQQNVVEAFEKSMATLGLFDSSSDAVNDEDAEVSTAASDDKRLSQVVCGVLNQGRRIDYMLQEREIETANEYVAALAAHSSYWVEKDLSLFIARQIYWSTLEMAAEIATADESNWESLAADSADL